MLGRSLNAENLSNCRMEFKYFFLYSLKLAFIRSEIIFISEDNSESPFFFWDFVIGLDPLDKIRESSMVYLFNQLLEVSYTNTQANAPLK